MTSRVNWSSNNHLLSRQVAFWLYFENVWHGAHPARRDTCPSRKLSLTSFAVTSVTDLCRNVAWLLCLYAYSQRPSKSTPMRTSIPVCRKPQVSPPPPQNRSTASIPSYRTFLLVAFLAISTKHIQSNTRLPHVQPYGLVRLAHNYLVLAHDHSMLPFMRILYQFHLLYLRRSCRRFCAFLPLPYSRRSDVALRIDSRSPGMTSAPIFAAAKVRRPASFSDAPVQKISF